MANKDPHQEFIDNHFKDIHMARPNKPITRWTGPELESGYIRNVRKGWLAGQHNDTTGVKAADDSLNVIGGEGTRRADIKNADNAQIFKDENTPVRKLMRAIGNMVTKKN